MDEIPNISTERAYRLAWLDTHLSPKWVSKLTGRSLDASRRLLEQSDFGGGCSPTELVELCRVHNVDLPPEFLRGAQDRAEADDERACRLGALITALQEKGVSEVVMDYADFLLFTTFDSSDEHPHTGEGGCYAYRKNSEGEVVGIVTGAAIQELGRGTSRRIEAEHQRDARLDIPATVEQVVRWVGKQCSVVELAIPDSDDYPVETARWVEAVARLVTRSPAEVKPARSEIDRPTVDPDAQWRDIPYSQKAKAIQRLVVDALNGLQSLDVNSSAVIHWIAENVAKARVRARSAGGYEFYNGAQWEEMTVRAIGGQLNTIRTRVRAVDEAETTR